MAEDADLGQHDAPALVLPFTVRGAAMSVIVFAALVAALQAAAPVLIPVLVSILLAYALEPAIALLIRLRVPRGVAAVVVFGLLLVGLRAAGRVVLADAVGFAHDLPETTAAIRSELAATHGGSPGVFDQLRRATVELEKATAAIAPSPTPAAAKTVTVIKPQITVTSLLVDNRTAVAWSGVYALSVGILTFVLLATGDIYKRKILRLAGPAAESRQLTLEVVKSIDRQIERYLVVRLLISAVVALLTAIALWALGLGHWFAWGIAAGVLNVMPFIGPTVAVAFIALAAFLQFKSLVLVAAAGGLSAIVAAFEGYVLTPWLTSRAAELNTVAVFVDVLFWGWLWGVWGLVLAVPILVAVKAAADHVEPLRPVGELLGK